MVGWCTQFLTMVGKEAPAHALDEELDDRERNHFWKTKKWAYANLNRLFVRYVITLRILSVGNGLVLNTPKVWQPQYESKEFNFRIGRILKVLHRQFRPRNSQRLLATD